LLFLLVFSLLLAKMLKLTSTVRAIDLAVSRTRRTRYSRR